MRHTVLSAHKLHPRNKGAKESPKTIQAVIAWVQGRGRRTDTMSTLAKIKQHNMSYIEQSLCLMKTIQNYLLKAPLRCLIDTLD
jgi:hypothetical protein